MSSTIGVAWATKHWSTDLVKHVLTEGGFISEFNAAYLRISRRRPSLPLSSVPLNRFFQEGAPDFTAPVLVPYDVAKAAVAEMGAVPPDATHTILGRSFKVLARFCGENYVSLANSFMAAHPGTSLLLDREGEAIIASSDDAGAVCSATDHQARRETNA